MNLLCSEVQGREAGLVPRIDRIARLNSLGDAGEVAFGGSVVQLKTVHSIRDGILPTRSGVRARIRR
ncbi:MAG: hypothetical protein QM779_05730 [Propionicimonas sp.]|uniref:hypothetical protein n=1 Tax=Propionicimonas sp. TaxID=1955623 RepID=UPI003D0D83EA